MKIIILVVYFATNLDFTSVLVFLLHKIIKCVKYKILIDKQKNNGILF